jgi:hypothetical protein
MSRPKRTSGATAREASIKAWTMGNDVPRCLAVLSSETTRSYAIILLCICSVILREALVYYSQSQQDEKGIL